MGSVVTLRRAGSKLLPIEVLGVDTMTSLDNRKNIALKLHGVISDVSFARGTEVCGAT
jgi:hypothetical protein